MIPLQFDLAKKHLRTEDSLMLTSILHKFNAAEDVEAHLWIYEYSMEENQNIYPRRGANTLTTYYTKRHLRGPLCYLPTPK